MHLKAYPLTALAAVNQVGSFLEGTFQSALRNNPQAGRPNGLEGHGFIIQGETQLVGYPPKSLALQR